MGFLYMLYHNIQEHWLITISNYLAVLITFTKPVVAAWHEAIRHYVASITGGERLMALRWRESYQESHTLRWRHNGRDSVSNHQPRDCLLNRLFRRTSNKASKLRVTGPWVVNSPGTGEFPTQMASDAENASIWWRHHKQFMNSILLILRIFGEHEYMFVFSIIFVTLKWNRMSTSSPEEDKYSIILHNQCNVCWWLCDTLSVRNRGHNPFLLEYSVWQTCRIISDLGLSPTCPQTITGQGTLSSHHIFTVFFCSVHTISSINIHEFIYIPQGYFIGSGQTFSKWHGFFQRSLLNWPPGMLHSFQF